MSCIYISFVFTLCVVVNFAEIVISVIIEHGGIDSGSLWKLKIKQKMENHFCHCHPLKKCLRIFFYNSLTTAEKCEKCFPIPKCDFAEYSSAGSEQSIRPSRMLVNTYIENCINLYKGLVVRQIKSGCDTMNVGVCVTYEVIQKAEVVWSLLKKENPRLRLPITLSFNPHQMDFSTFHSSLPINSISEDGRKNVKIELQGSAAFKNTVEWVLDHFPRSHAPQNVCSRKIRLDVGLTETKEDGRNTPLSDYRKFLTAKFIAKALGKSGFQVDINKHYRIPSGGTLENQLFLVFSWLNTPSTDSTVFRIKIGNVYVSKSTLANVSPNVTAEYLFNLRYDQVNAVSLFKASPEQKSSPTWSTAVSNLTVATINFDLLTKEPTSDCNLLHNQNMQFQDSGALNVMYNYARVTSILHTFNKNVEVGMYPALPSLKEIDFAENSLSELQLIQILMHWPMVVENIIDFVRDEISVSPILAVIRELTQRFVNFYTVDVVLLKNPADHNMNKMMKRIYLLKAIRCVYEEFFELALIDFDK